MRKRNVLLALGVAVLIVGGTIIQPSSVLAYDGTKIPTEMQPETVIRYTTDKDFEIVKGGFLSTKELEKLQQEQKSTQDMLQGLLNEKISNQNIDRTESYYEEIKPSKDMVVTYADDGMILDIKSPNTIQKDLVKETTDVYGIVLPEGVSAVRTWGSAPNKLYINRSTNRIIGTGRATTFTVTKGQGNHTMKKGEVATKLSYDNCQLGMAVKVSAPKKSGGRLEVTMKKWDAGGMPNAIVDIWKTGVEYWGYKYTSSLSINGVSIEHGNIDVNGKKLY